MPLQFAGIGSGIDVANLVSQLMAVERRPLALLERRKSEFNNQLSAYGGMKASLATLQSAANALAGAARFSATRASIADASVASASSSGSAAAGTYSLEVQALAQAHKLRSGAFATTADSVGSGSLTIEFGTYAAGAFALNPDKTAKTISIGTGQQSLAGVRDAINAANAGVSASIVNDGSGSRLVISSTDSGAANALRLTAADDDGNHTDAAGLSRLAYSAETGGVAHLAETVAARNATLVIDGITVSKASNTISDAIEGVTLNLIKAAPGSPTTLGVARDVDGARAAVEAFVKAYNDTSRTLRAMSAYDPASRSAATLQGDSALISVQARLRAAVSEVVEHAGGYDTLSALGIAFQLDGTLLADATKLRAALADTSRDAASAFAALGKTSAALVRFSGAGANAVAGVPALHVTQLATRGSALGSQAAALTITAGANDTLEVAVDGVAQSVTLAAGSFTAASLATILQSRIAGVDASQSAGVLTLASRAWGAASTVALTGGSALAGLFGAPASTGGLDVAGTIGGVAATGAGQTLSAQGLSASIEGGATGARGTLRFSRGVGERLRSQIDDLLKGTITSRTDGLANSIRTLDARRAAAERRLESVEQRLRTQFSALDTMIASMNTTSSFLTQQLAALPGARRNT